MYLLALKLLERAIVNYLSPQRYGFVEAHTALTERVLASLDGVAGVVGGAGD